MKKMMVLIVIVGLLISSTALADEILFRGIPWNSTPLTFVSSLEEEGTYFDNVNAWAAKSDFIDIESSYFATSQWSVSDVPVYTLERFDGEKKLVCVVAGYDVERVVAYFMPIYDTETIDTQDMENAQLYKVRYLFKNFSDGVTVDSAYDDLLVRLTKLYGEGADASGEVYERACHWVGDDGTSVSLCRGSSIYVLGIYIPATLIVEYQCALDEDYVIGLVNAYNATMDTDGGL